MLRLDRPSQLNQLLGSSGSVTSMERLHLRMGRLAGSLYVATALSIAGCGRDTVPADGSSAQIEIVLLRDSLAAYGKNSCGSQRAVRITEAMRAIDLSQTPSDFAVAYRDHIEAWNSVARAKDSDELAAGNRSVGDTFATVKRIAISYGAALAVMSQ